MGELIKFVTKNHTNTKRDYLERVVKYDKAKCAEIATQFGKDYWDGERQYGYGGYKYDGRWFNVAKEIAEHYNIKPGDKILDVGCGKGFLLHEFTRAVPGVKVKGIDISEYGIANSKEEVRPFLQLGNATKLPFEDKSFDFVLSITTLHNLYNYDLHKSLQEIARVSKGKGYVAVEAYRNEREKVNLMYWQLTCRQFKTPEEWVWTYNQAGYTGDYEFIYFE